MTNKNIRVFFRSLVGRNSDPGGFFKRSDNYCNISWSEGLNNPIISNTLRSLMKTPWETIYSRIILNKRFEKEIIQSAIKTSENIIYAKGKSNKLINIDIATNDVRFISISNEEDIECLKEIFYVASAWHYSQEGANKLLKLTKGKYKRVDVHRIMKTASTSISDSLRNILLGPPPYSFCHKGMSEGLLGRMGKDRIVESSWNPIAYATNAFNFSQSHYPINSFHRKSKSTYSLISLRDPLDRICSFINSFLDINNQSTFFSSEQDFIENAHPDWILGQLYYLSQNNNLEEAKKELKNLSRVLICENSHCWDEVFNSDLNIEIKTQNTKKGYYKEKNSMKARVESLISKSEELSAKLNDEYKLYEYGKKLSLQ